MEGEFIIGFCEPSIIEEVLKHRGGIRGPRNWEKGIS